MDKRTYLLALVVAAFLLSTPASAGVLYDNGSANFGSPLGAWKIYNDGVINYAVADSFTLTTASTLTGVGIDLWLSPEDSPVSLDWGISATPDYSQSLGGGTVGLPVSGVLCFCGLEFYQVISSSFSLPNLVLGPGTYYRSFQKGVTRDGSGLYWDIDNGPSVAYENQLGPVANVNIGGTVYPGSNSDSFTIFGNTSGVPEPAGTAMFLSGLALVAGLARRKMRA